MLWHETSNDTSIASWYLETYISGKIGNDMTIHIVRLLLMLLLRVVAAIDIMNKMKKLINKPFPIHQDWVMEVKMEGKLLAYTHFYKRKDWEILSTKATRTITGWFFFSVLFFSSLIHRKIFWKNDKSICFLLLYLLLYIYICICVCFQFMAENGNRLMERKYEAAVPVYYYKPSHKDCQ